MMMAATRGCRGWCLLLTALSLLQVTCDPLATAVNTELQNLVIGTAADVVDRIVKNLLGLN